VLYSVVASPNGTGRTVGPLSISPYGEGQYKDTVLYSTMKIIGKEILMTLGRALTTLFKPSQGFIDPGPVSPSSLLTTERRIALGVESALQRKGHTRIRVELPADQAGYRRQLNLISLGFCLKPSRHQGETLEELLEFIDMLLLSSLGEVDPSTVSVPLWIWEDPRCSADLQTGTNKSLLVVCEDLLQTARLFLCLYQQADSLGALADRFHRLVNACDMVRETLFPGRPARVPDPSVGKDTQRIPGNGGNQSAGGQNKPS